MSELANGISGDPGCQSFNVVSVIVIVQFVYHNCFRKVMMSRVVLMTHPLDVLLETDIQTSVEVE